MYFLRRLLFDYFVLYKRRRVPRASRFVRDFGIFLNQSYNLKSVCLCFTEGGFADKKAFETYILCYVKNCKAVFLALSLDIGKNYLYN